MTNPLDKLYLEYQAYLKDKAAGNDSLAVEFKNVQKYLWIKASSSSLIRQTEPYRDDVINSSLMKLWNTMDSRKANFEEPTKILGLLLTITHNTAISVLRKNTKDANVHLRFREESATESKNTWLIWEEDGDESETSWRAFQDRVNESDILKRLSFDGELLQALLEGKSVKEFASLSGQPYYNVSKNWERFRWRLRATNLAWPTDDSLDLSKTLPLAHEARELFNTFLSEMDSTQKADVVRSVFLGVTRRRIKTQTGLSIWEITSVLKEGLDELDIKARCIKYRGTREYLLSVIERVRRELLH